ncbi:MAG: restriction endonuclease subunit S [Planctomycetes bacterium]|nr:restriction endonuclease subunit S [Planctomycetota bacterium]
MGSEWPTGRLGDFADVQTGPFGSQLHKKDYVEVGTPIITVEHLGDNRIVHSNLPRVSEKDRLRLKKYWMKYGDIIFSRVGSVDRRAYVHIREDGWLFSGRCLRVRATNQRLDSRFLSFFFGLESVKEHIRQIAVGATMPSLNTSLLSNIEIIVPPLFEQRAIAHLLA